MSPTNIVLKRGPRKYNNKQTAFSTPESTSFNKFSPKARILRKPTCPQNCPKPSGPQPIAAAAAASSQRSNAPEPPTRGSIDSPGPLMTSPRVDQQPSTPARGTTAAAAAREAGRTRASRKMPEARAAAPRFERGTPPHRYRGDESAPAGALFPRPPFTRPAVGVCRSVDRVRVVVCRLGQDECRGRNESYV